MHCRRVAIVGDNVTPIQQALSHQQFGGQVQVGDRGHEIGEVRVFPTLGHNSLQGSRLLVHMT
jgi:hypothetical protein